MRTCKIFQYDNNEDCSLESIAMILRSDSFGASFLHAQDKHALSRANIGRSKNHQDVGIMLNHMVEPLYEF